MLPDPAPSQEAAPLSLAQVVNALAAQLDPDLMGTGPMAALRRLDPGGPLVEPALLRLLVQRVPDGWWAGAGIHRWALVIHAMALAAPDLHRGRGPADRLGRALFDARFSELRLARLLEAGPDNLVIAVPRTVRFLVAKGRSFDSVPLARFVLGAWAGGSRADEQREELARDYFRAEREARPAA